MDIESISALIVVVLLFMLSGAFSASEIAFFTLSQSQIDNLKKDDDQISQIILLLLDKPKRLLATMLTANIFINVAAIVLGSILIYEFFSLPGSKVLAMVVQIGLLSLILLFFGELVPKIYATNNSLKVARRMARPMLFAQQLLFPLSMLLVNSTNLVEKRIISKKHNITMDELSEALDLSESQDQSPTEERRILKGIIKFGDIAVREIMHPRVDVTAVDDSSTFTGLLSIINESGYSRIPIYNDNLDNVTGILYIKDLIPHIQQPADFDWQPLQRPAFFVPENKRINDLLQEFQTKKIHMAIVVDEYGGTSGIVTLEDILEEIVGEINDEFDSEIDEISYTMVDEHTYIFEGKTLLNDFCKVIGVDDRMFQEVKGESDTLAGLVLEMAGRIPDATEQFEYGRFILKPEVVDKRSIKMIRVILKEEDKEE